MRLYRPTAGTVASRPAFGSQAELDTKPTLAAPLRSRPSLSATTSSGFAPHRASGEDWAAPEEARVRQAGQSTGVPGSSAPPTPAQAGPAPAPPTLVSGLVELLDRGNAFASPLSSSGFVPSRFDVASDFTAKTKDVVVSEPADSGFMYGLVQNVVFDHFEATYSKGDMLVDAVGPFLDIFPGEPAPFMHDGSDNPVFPSVLFTRLGVAAQFTDKPSWPLEPFGRYCNEEVSLRTARRSLMFRIGLVARNISNQALIQLGATNATYQIKWDVTADPTRNTRSLNSQNKLAGTLGLTSPGVTLTLAPPTGVEKINEAVAAEKRDMASRCEKVLEIQQPSLV